MWWLINRQNPYALEATLALTDLAASKETSMAFTNATGAIDPTANPQFRQREIERFYAKLSTMRSSAKFISRVDAAWMQTLVNAHMNAKRGRYRGACSAWSHCNFHAALIPPTVVSNGCVCV